VKTLQSIFFRRERLLLGRPAQGREPPRRRPDGREGGRGWRPEYEHICTGPVRVKGAEPGDILEVRIVDAVPRPSGNPAYQGKTFGSNAAAN